MTTAVFLQARLDSTRLPRKALLPLAGRPVIEHAMDSLRRVRADLHVLLTDEASFAELKPHATLCGFLSFAGPKEDVLARFALAAREYRVDRIIRATGDNPLVSRELAQGLLLLHEKAGAAFSAFSGPPIGTGVEIVEAEALLCAADSAVDPYEREHVNPYLYRRPEQFAVNRPQAGEEFCLPGARVTLDTEEDYRFLLAVYRELYDGEAVETDRLVAWLKCQNRYTLQEGYQPGTESALHPIGPAR